MDRIESLAGRLTLEEKVALVSGSDLWHTAPVERLGIPRLRLSDGPNGVRGPSYTKTTACFPCGTALAATFNPALVRQVGEAMGEEARTKGVHVVLGPTTNMHRSPLAGRNFECFSEDPHLAARMTVAVVEGVQSKGVAACVKHFVCNDSEFERFTISSRVSERALREIYLPPFEAAVVESRVRSVMAAYNRINGVHATEHRELLEEVLRNEWGFDGVIVSDWGATRNTVQAALAGLDLEMPGPPRVWGPQLLEAVRSEEVPEKVLDEKVRRLLSLFEWCRLLDEGERPEESLDDPSHRAVARRAAAESIVLLKNEGGLLPLDRSRLDVIAVIGPNAEVAQVQGGGSCQVRPHYAISPLHAIREAAEGIEVVFEQGCTIHRRTPPLDIRSLAGPITVDYFDNPDLEGEAVLTEEIDRAVLVFTAQFSDLVPFESFSVRCRASVVPDRSGSWTLALTSRGRSRLSLNGELVVDNWEPQPVSGLLRGPPEGAAKIDLVAGANYDLEVVFSVTPGQVPLLIAGGLPPVPKDLMERAVDAAAGADAVVVVAGSSPEWETEGRDRRSVSLPGDQDELIRRVAAANRNTVVVVNAGSPVDMNWADGVPSIVQLWYSGQEGGRAIADVLFGAADPSGRLPATIPLRYQDNPAYLNYPGEGGEVSYGEGIFIGYRYYDAKRIEPRFAFGHGLSYTTFAYGDLVSDRSTFQPGDEVRVSIEITNTGSRAGFEVVQLYVRDVESTVARPPKELKAFEKVYLDAGETRQIAFTLDRRAFAFWDPASKSWRVEPGEFEILAGSSSRDIRASTKIVCE